MMRKRVALSALALALLTAGCGGGSSGSTGSGGSRGSGGSAGSGAVPSGFSVYHASGFSFAAPSGYKATANPLQGLPPDASSYLLSPGNQQLSASNTQIMEIRNPHLDHPLDQVASTLRSADEANPSLRNVQTSEQTTTVKGAQAARIVSESYTAVNPAGVSPHTVQFKRTWLMVTPNPSTLLDLVVITEPQRGGTLDPSTVFGTFRLGG